ncbi:MAG: hypothetical protein B7Z59_03570 [Acidiphilium sp. 37-67-22]|nr:MAG: hypothetical protein B7Z59_03570 [Acidiphilium sp. 37-67-22]
MIHHLEKNNILQEGKKGLVFGVGTERLPSLFANMGASIVATDAPPEIGDAWKGGDQFSENLSGLYFKDLVDYQNFERRVSYKTCDMNNIDEEFINFDFNWSSCCFEHLGSLENGMNFVINSVEKTLKQNGIAVHTTEFNLSSNNETLETGHTVIYRRRDIEELVNRLERRGHSVQSFVIAPDSHPLDFHVDIPPYIHAPHIRLMYEKYIVTSVGLVIKRGRV